MRYHQRALSRTESQRPPQWPGAGHTALLGQGATGAPFFGEERLQGDPRWARSACSPPGTSEIFFLILCLK